MKEIFYNSNLDWRSDKFHQNLKKYLTEFKSINDYKFEPASKKRTDKKVGGYYNNSTKTIIINSTLQKNYAMFLHTLLHEIGHALLHSDTFFDDHLIFQDSIGLEFIYIGSIREEREANIFAEAVLRFIYQKKDIAYFKKTQLSEDIFQISNHYLRHSNLAHRYEKNIGAYTNKPRTENVRTLLIQKTVFNFIEWFKTKKNNSFLSTILISK